MSFMLDNWVEELLSRFKLRHLTKIYNDKVCESAAHTAMHARRDKFLTSTTKGFLTDLQEELGLWGALLETMPPLISTGSMRDRLAALRAEVGTMTSRAREVESEEGPDPPRFVQGPPPRLPPDGVEGSLVELETGGAAFTYTESEISAAVAAVIGGEELEAVTIEKGWAQGASKTIRL